MKRVVVAVLTGAVLMMMSVAPASAQPDREEFFVETLVTGVVQGESRTTPNDKWVFFEGKYVRTEGVATIGTTSYDLAVLEVPAIWGKLSPDGTIGTEWGTFTLSLDSGELECHGTLKVKRYVDERYPDASPVPYGESGKFRADCDDGAKVMGDFVGEFGFLNGAAGFVVTLDGMAR